MPSFQAFCPGPTTSLSAEGLSREIAKRGPRCHVENDDDGPFIVFDGCGDVLHLTIVDGRIDYLEHGPDYSATPRMSGFISAALDAIGFEWIDEDDPRWRAA
jgi:hypothetical protein